MDGDEHFCGRGLQETHVTCGVPGPYGLISWRSYDVALALDKWELRQVDIGVGVNSVPLDSQERIDLDWSCTSIELKDWSGDWDTESETNDKPCNSRNPRVLRDRLVL